MQREATAAIGRSDPSPYLQHHRAIVLVDDGPQGATLIDNYRSGNYLAREVNLGDDANCPPRAPSVALTWPNYYTSEQMVAWACTRSSDGSSVVRLQSIYADGTLYPGPQTIDGAGTINQDNPVVSVDGIFRDGYLAWSGELSPGRYSVFYSRVYGGSPSGQGFAVESFPRSQAPLQPSLAADSQGGALIAWTGTQSQPPFDRAVQLAVVSDRYWMSQILVLDHDPLAAFGTAMVSQERQGQKVVVWTRDGGVFAQRIDSANQPVGGILTVAPVDGTIRSAARVTVDERDGFWVGWQSTGQDGDGEGIYVRQYRRDGTAADAETLVNQIRDGDELFGSIGTSSVGRLNAVWTRPDGGKHLAYERTMLGLGDDDYFPQIRVNGTDSGQYVQFDIDFRHQSPGGSITPLANWNLVLHLPPNFADPSLLGCSGYGTDTVTCPRNGMASTLPLRFDALPPGDYPISVTMDLPFVDGVPSDNTTSVLLHVQDTTPDAINFANVENATPGALVVSAPITLTGFTVPQPASVSGGEYSLDGVNFSTAAFTASAGQQVWLRHIAASAINQSVYTTLTVNLMSGTFISTTGIADGTPDAFAFVDVTGATPNTRQTSNAITVSGINLRAPISVSSGSYSINGGYYTSSPGFVVNGDTVRLGVDTYGYASTSDTTVTIGGVSDTWTVTSQARDVTPDAFSFVDVTGVQLNSSQTSSTVFVSGINDYVPISVTGGLYRINNGAFTASAGTVRNGDWVQVQHTSSASYGVAVNTTLTIGGVSDTFTSTTRVLDTTPDYFYFLGSNNIPRNTTMTGGPITVSGIDSPAPISVTGGSYSINGGAFTTAPGTVTNGQSVRVQHQSAATFNTSTTTTLTIGGVSGAYTSLTEQMRATPNAFVFTDVTGVARGSVQTSNTIYVAGINTPVQVSVSGGSYSVDGGPFTTAVGQVSSGAAIRVQHTASSAFSTATNTTLTIGGVSDTYTSTTLAGDTTPDAFSFTDVGNVGLGANLVSNAITVGGINAPAPISVVGGSYSIDGGAFTSVAGTVQSGQSVRVQHTASSAFSTATNTTLTIGGVSDTYTSTTLAQDATPDAFSFTDVTGVALSSLQTSNAIQVTGANVTMPISISGGSYSINGGAFTSAAGSVASGASVRVQHTASAAFSTATNTTLTIGGVSDTYTSTTLAADTTPDAFSFTDLSGVKRNTQVESNTITVSGINTAAPITISGSYAFYSRNGGAFTAVAGSVNNGDTIKLRVNSATGANAVVNVVLNIGGVSDTWSVTTK